MQIGSVRVRMPHRFVCVLVGMGLGALVAAMRVLVMLVVDVAVIVRQTVMRVFVTM